MFVDLNLVGVFVVSVMKVVLMNIIYYCVGDACCLSLLLEMISVS